MKNTLLLFAALSLFLASCGPEPTPEPEPKTLTGHVFVSHFTNEWGQPHWGFYFVSDSQYDYVFYDPITEDIYPDGSHVYYTFNYPDLILEGGDKMIVNEDYTEILEPGPNRIYKKVKFNIPE